MEYLTLGVAGPGFKERDLRISLSVSERSLSYTGLLGGDALSGFSSGLSQQMLQSNVFSHHFKYYFEPRDGCGPHECDLVRV